jgi:hypothetical protein
MNAPEIYKHRHEKPTDGMTAKEAVEIASFKGGIPHAIDYVVADGKKALVLENSSAADDDGDMWREMKKEGQAKRWDNVDKSLNVLRQRGIAYKTLNADVCHYRVAQHWDFWPSTGKFRNYKTNETGRGVFNLIKRLSIKHI